MPRGAVAQALPIPTPDVIDIQDDTVRKLVQRGLDAARSAGAEYADVRLVHRQERQLGINPMTFGDYDFAGFEIGVRARIGGAWGFSSVPSWNGDTVVQTAQAAVSTARAHTIAGNRSSDWGSVPPVVNGHWESPIKIDPFTVDHIEMIEVLAGLQDHARLETTRRTATGGPPKPISVWSGVSFYKRQVAFGSSEGGYCTQVLYTATGMLREINRSAWNIGFRCDAFTPTMAGWELISDYSHDDIDKTIDELVENLSLPTIGVDVGRYAAVFDAESVAALAGETLGLATEFDRVLGDDAHSTGTSYLDDPVTMLDSYRIGAQSLSVDVDRTMSGGAGTVGWDDEGTPAAMHPLIEHGVLRNFQTDREGAGWLRAATKESRPFTSMGCAYGLTGNDMPVVATANLRVRGGESDAGFEELIATLDHGIAFRETRTMLDFQKLTGATVGPAYLIRKGKRVARIEGAGILFKSPEFWKNITALGGTTHSRRFGFEAKKNELGQTYYYSVETPPASFKDITVIDVRRK